MILLVVSLLAFSNILCVSLNAQISSGALSGIVTDTASQAPIPDAQVGLIHLGVRASEFAFFEHTPGMD